MKLWWISNLDSKGKSNSNKIVQKGLKTLVSFFVDRVIIFVSENWYRNLDV